MERLDEEEPAILEPKKTKYDRIWGESGQAALETASICLLNCGLTGSEALKNLVLGGIGSITIGDRSKVEIGELGNNFMVDSKSVGRSKAKCVCSFLQELNDAVQANFIEENPYTLMSTNPSFFSQFTLVVGTQLVEDSMVKLDRICREANVMLVFARSYGLTGFVFITVKEHTAIDSKPDHFLDDLRLNNPWPELKRWAEERAQTHSSNLPSTREEQKEFKDLVKSKMVTTDEDNYKEATDAAFKVFASTGTSQQIQEFINDRCAEVNLNSSDFWEFISNDGGGEAPLEGSMPDMTSSTEHYTKAEIDFHIKVLSQSQLSRTSARMQENLRYHIIEEFRYPSVTELHKCLADEDYRLMDEDISRLKSIALNLLSEIGCDGFVLQEELYHEMCRFGAAELHVVGAFIGGIASQEVIKLITKQFIPMPGTLIFNGIDHMSQSLKL